MLSQIPNLWEEPHHLMGATWQLMMLTCFGAFFGIRKCGLWYETPVLVRCSNSCTCTCICIFDYNARYKANLKDDSLVERDSIRNLSYRITVNHPVYFGLTQFHLFLYLPGVCLMHKRWLLLGEISCVQFIKISKRTITMYICDLLV